MTLWIPISVIVNIIIVTDDDIPSISYTHQCSVTMTIRCLGNALSELQTARLPIVDKESLYRESTGNPSSEPRSAPSVYLWIVCHVMTIEMNRNDRYHEILWNIMKQYNDTFQTLHNGSKYHEILTGSMYDACAWTWDMASKRGVSLRKKLGINGVPSGEPT